ncbi:MAG TPA: translation initiation factor IF-2 [Solirubrobacterales bacterium]|nr:translation initiation factor IF-2 [Solirubrobacterales bacterium]
MAKQRVHEIAKALGLESKNVLDALKDAGVEVKTASSSVEQQTALKALASAGALPKKAAPSGNGGVADSATEAKPKQKTESKGSSKPAEKPAKPAAKKPVRPPADADQGAAKSAAPAKPTPKPQAAPKPDGGGDAAGGKRRRRVVIDSQASRRDQMGGPPPQRPPRRRGRRRRPVFDESPERKGAEPEEQEALKINSGATVREVSETLGVSSAEVIKTLMQLGEMATLTQTLPDETILVVAEKLDREVEMVRAEDEVADEPTFDDDDADLVERPPVVTIMGHVDHGKTSLLDAIRETEVAAGEAGGITQHIGAYQVHHEDKTISFLDTPGHEAFTAMRARGAKVTDVAIIVVAADDGVMPQTVEAIDHAKAADVPVMIAVNKIDKEGADPNRVRGELAERGLNPEDWGGDTIFCDVSAQTKEGLENLLHMILLVTELEELKANPGVEASGVVIESHLDPGRGPVVSVLVQRGTMRVGDSLVAGSQWGRVRAMHDHTGTRIEEAVPGDPVEVLGFDGVCEAGERAQVVDNDRRARQLAQERANRLKTEALARRQARRVTLEEVFAKAKEGEIKQLNLLLKADVSGSLEALQDEIAKLPQDQVGVDVIRAAPGGINESDVMLAAASDAIIIGFNVRPLSDARRAAEAEGVEIRTYSVIYKITEELRAAMEGMLEPEEVEETVGELEVLELFKASRVGTIAGSRVNEGKVTRDAEIRVVRDGTVVWTGRVGSLRRFKDDVSEVENGQECGVTLDGFADVKVGDVLEVFKTTSVEQTLS